MVAETMPAADPPKPPFLPGLGGVRALAALAVLLGHAAAWITPLPASPWLHAPLARLTHCGLSAFFVLSGFVLQYNHGRSLAAGGESTARFALARLARIYPIYLLLFAVALAEVVARHSWRGVDAGNVLVRGLLAQSWFFTPSWPAIFPLSWALSTEAFFYVVFPPAARLTARLGSPRTAIAAGALCLAAILGLDALTALRWPQLFAFVLGRFPEWANAQEQLAGTLFGWLTYVNPFFRVFEFLLGAVAARLFVLSSSRPAGLDIMAGAGLLAVLLLPFPTGAFFLTVLENNALYAPFLAALCLAWAGRPRSWTTGRRMAGVAAASLSVYLIQSWTLPPWKAPAGASPLAWIGLALAGSAATLLVGSILARRVEIPLARLVLSRFRRPVSNAGTGAGAPRG